jgi:N4-(beta-N-acetylglucosaminyl)-L-asparaginase
VAICLSAPLRISAASFYLRKLGYNMPLSRRDFLAATAAGSLVVSLDATGQEQKPSSGRSDPKAPQPIIICAANGFNYLDAAFDFLKNGGDTLDAALKVVQGPENDPKDTSVGYGGLPNEDGVVELDACCMHGPTKRAGSVGALQNIKNASLVAKAIMDHTGHVMLVGKGAERFALDMGFPRQNMLTDHARRIWLLWKEYHSSDDWWGPNLSDPDWKPPGVGPQSELWQERLNRLEKRAAAIGIEPELRLSATRKVMFPPTGTIHCSVLNERGELSGCTTTSGLAFKLAGRVGDSPIIGAGCFTDQEVGSAGATGSGEENIKVAGAHTVIENLRHGMSPHEAGMDALKRVAQIYDNNMEKLRFVDMTYYVLRKDGAYAGVSLWDGYAPDRIHKIAIHDGTKRLEKTTSLFKGMSQDFPPFPKIPANRMKDLQE